MNDTRRSTRVAVDIGGTFTDVALECPSGLFTAKTLTTHDLPETGVLSAIRTVLGQAGRNPSEVGLIVYGTTLATNLLIERKGSPTALITTEGFRDTIEMRNESRYEQYDLGIDLPPPLVERRLRLPVRERVDATGRVLIPLDESAVVALVPQLLAAGVRSVAVGFLHSYRHEGHERRVREILAEHAPALEVTLSCEVSPEMREYERFSTACANAYVQPLMSQHLRGLNTALGAEGFDCPLYLMLSGGGLTTLETAVRFPVRLVESGPAGGAIFASHIARTLGLDSVVSYDMGGTTAKICLIDDGHPQTSRAFEVARVYRFLKGSGLPLRIPVVEMVEIGAGGGSIAGLDGLGRIAVGPQSAGSEPGPACYRRGGQAPTVTDADVLLGRIDPAGFADGQMALDTDAAARALSAAVGEPLGLDATAAALGVSEMVDENMANAARVHAVESGKEIEARTLIAFGGAAPLHAGRIAEKLGMDRVIVPPGAGVGSAIGFLRAPVAYEVTRSLYQRLGNLDVDTVNGHLDAMRAEAHAVVEGGAAGRPLTESRTAFMRYVGQGHEVGVELPVPVEAVRLDADGPAVLQAAFEREYHRLYERTIPGLDVEVLTWVLLISTEVESAEPGRAPAARTAAHGTATRALIDPRSGERVSVPVLDRDSLVAEIPTTGAAVVTERHTTTVVPAGFAVSLDRHGNLILERPPAGGSDR